MVVGDLRVVLVAGLAVPLRKRESSGSGRSGLVARHSKTGGEQRREPKRAHSSARPLLIIFLSPRLKYPQSCSSAVVRVRGHLSASTRLNDKRVSVVESLTTGKTKGGRWFRISTPRQQLGSGAKSRYMNHQVTGCCSDHLRHSLRLPTTLARGCEKSHSGGNPRRRGRVVCRLTSRQHGWTPCWTRLRLAFPHQARHPIFGARARPGSTGLMAVGAFCHGLRFSTPTREEGGASGAEPCCRA